MVGRFRLLDKWLDFVRQRKSTMRVISEDQWRQVGGAGVVRVSSAASRHPSFCSHPCTLSSFQHLEKCVCPSICGRKAMVIFAINPPLERSACLSGNSPSSGAAVAQALLDFSRSVYEDLSNFDPNGAWACCLDEFVDHMRNTRSCLWDQ
eukprot:scaffold66971_cov17-Tisochrysis_lutea.AAC.1